MMHLFSLEIHKRGLSHAWRAAVAHGEWQWHSQNMLLTMVHGQAFHITNLTTPNQEGTSYFPLADVLGSSSGLSPWSHP